MCSFVMKIEEAFQLGAREFVSEDLATEAVSARPRCRQFERWFAITSVAVLVDKSFPENHKNFLHLWKFPVISQLRTNFAEMPGNRCPPWEPRTEVVDPKLRRGGGESESLEEEAIEIGNSYRIH
jgi:hypothetical protein